jgi:hypothetical protein
VALAHARDWWPSLGRGLGGRQVDPDEDEPAGADGALIDLDRELLIEVPIEWPAA